MASDRTRKRKQQRLAAKARRARIAADRLWWSGLSNQEKHDADYYRYRVDVLGHSQMLVVQEMYNEHLGKLIDSLSGSSPLYARLTKKGP